MPSLKTGRPRPISMESTPRQSPAVSRTAEVLYLLSRGAQLEHPHMINVHFAAHQPGPTLRDVKARLVALRGKGMPDSFSWSYKRNYKDTFIWCDLFDDDLILPLTGSEEYMLKAVKLFDVASQDGELEYEELPPLLPIRDFSPSKSSSRLSSRPEHAHVENDVSMAIKKSLLLINIPQAADIASKSSMDLNKQVMNNLSHSKGAPEVCSLEHSDVSSCRTFPSCEDAADQSKTKQSSSKSSSAARTERTNSSSQTGTSPTSPKIANQEKHRNAASQTAQREPASHKDVTTDCNLEPATTMTSKKDEMTSVSPLPVRTPGSEGCTRRRIWEKEIDKNAIYTQFVSQKNGSDVDERPGSAASEECSGSNSCVSGPDDPFLYGVLRKATRLGSSFRPRLCRGVDVVDSTRTKTKLHYRAKSKGEGHVKQPSSFIDEPSSKNGTTSPAEVNSETKSYGCYTSPEKPVKEFKSLSEFFDTKERANSNSSTPVDKLINEPHSVEEAPRPTQLDFAQEDSSATMVSDHPRRPFGNEALDASYRKTMEVLAKLPNSRGACKVHTMPQREGHRSTMSESKGNKQEVKLESRPSSKVRSASYSRQAATKPSCEHDDLLHHSCSIHGMDDPVVVRTPEESTKDVTASKQRRPAVKKASMASFEASTFRCGLLHSLVTSCRAKATVKIPDEKTYQAPRNVSKESTGMLQLNIVEDSTKPQRPESFTSDSRALHSGNKQGLKVATQVAATKVDVVDAEATSKMNSNEGAKRWPFEPPARPRNFKSREDRPLIPGLTNMDWEKSLQEACMHSEPPANLVLHECSQCGRTFKLESLQVHMRGCRGAVNKPKPSLAKQRRVSL
ncbi:hypothetical protein KC19_11G122000 [Ceratodon purpureus]|uniref:C2HC/C3H-type domain-containing protein n=1 Tax=Ceratodon purpureus TaxID=3225 RepID=A0A8T0GJQ1_CERPU|nr:hypothetical protein KC19_11G122000 [Ceratodon purpureus]